MNRLVSINQVGGMRLRLRDAHTDIDFGVFSATNMQNEEPQIDFENNIAKFDLSAKNSRLIIGNYYKIQIAYVAFNGLIGYYSTVAITKCTAQPTITIMNSTNNIINSSFTTYIGEYNNTNDPSEKNFQYMFELSLADGNILDTTNWQYHNANLDTEGNRSQDIYYLNQDISQYGTVYIQYMVKTNNGLICKSDKYQIIYTYGPALDLQANLIAQLDYDNGCINLSLQPRKNNSSVSYSGKFLLSRACEKNNYATWLPIFTFELVGSLPSTLLFTDFTCEQGETYKYCIQAYNDNNIQSARMVSNTILMQFEHIYLYDGEKQLKISFNPKISSFKTVLQESKKTTLGAQYPFFFQGGNIRYKEFPISGLLSYIMDDNEYFISKEKDLGMVNKEDIFDITDENLTYERKFKLKVLDWLNNGELKLFKSAAEGNYIVKLSNISLTENDSLSRMLATFSGTATEAMEYNEDNLIKYNFLNSSNKIFNDLYYYEIDLKVLANSNFGQNNLILSGQCANLEIKNNSNQYLTFEIWNNNTFISQLQINPYTTYQNDFSNNPFDTLKHMTNNPNFINSDQVIIKIGILLRNATRFNQMKALNSSRMTDYYDYLGTNWISNTFTNKEQLSKIFSIKFTKNQQVYTFNNVNDLQTKMYCRLTNNDSNFLVKFNNNNVYNLFTLTSTTYIIINNYGGIGQAIFQYSSSDTDEYDAILIQMPNDKINDTSSLGINQIYIDGILYDLTHKSELDLNNFEMIPQVLQWGCGVSALITYEMANITYDFETSNSNGNMRKRGFLNASSETLNYSDWIDSHLLEPIENQIKEKENYGFRII